MVISESQITLKLFNSQLLSKTKQLNLYSVKDSWNEEEVTWDNQPNV